MNHFTPFLGMTPPRSHFPNAAIAIALLCLVQFGCGLTVGMMLAGGQTASSATLGILGD